MSGNGATGGRPVRLEGGGDHGNSAISLIDKSPGRVKSGGNVSDGVDEWLVGGLHIRRQCIEGYDRRMVGIVLHHPQDPRVVDVFSSNLLAFDQREQCVKLEEQPRIIVRQQIGVDLLRIFVAKSSR